MGDYRPSDSTTDLYYSPKPSSADLTHQGRREGTCKSKSLKLTHEREHLQVKLFIIIIVRVNKFGFNEFQLVEILNSTRR